MVQRARFYYALLAGAAALVVLLVITAMSPQPFGSPGLLLFLAGTTAFSLTYSVPIGGGVVSLMPMTVAAAYLMMGKVSAMWTVLFGLLAQAGLRALRGRARPELHEPRGSELIERTAMNLGMHLLGLLAGASVVESLGVEVPLLALDASTIARLVLGAAVYLGINYLLAATWIAGHGRQAVRRYVDSLERLALFEGLPIAIAPLFPLINLRLGFPYLLLFAASLAAASLISHYLGRAQQRLERRVSELASLQAVGQTLSASLDVETVMVAIYEQVKKLMPASSFYIALHDQTLDEVSFPMVIEDGVRSAQVMRRRAGNGLTEYLIRTGRALLLDENVAERVAGLGVTHIGRAAECWLGVPIKAGNEVLGAMAVQSHEGAGIYDQSHKEILQTIASQAAIALQNARLYERTDDALARRVQELDSVLRTSDDGVLLMDVDWRVLAVNRALAGFVGLSQFDFGRHPIDALQPGGESLVNLIEYSLDGLKADTDRLRRGEAEQVQDEIVFQISGLQAERTLTPVRDAAGAIVGWLLVFRDLTEELELQHLREDMIDMLVHDLRSPISLVMASLAMLGDATRQDDEDQTDRLIGIAQRSSERMLGLIDDLLQISQLERGQLPLDLEPTSVESLVGEASARYVPAASASNIVLRTEVADGVPCVLVDRTLVGRVLANLVDNALKFTEDGGEVVVRAATGSPTAPGQVVMSVADTGPGIPSGSWGKLFEKFQQVSEVRGRRRGTGLGLPFCKLVVEAHGGSIWVDSEVGRGSEFYISLPADGHGTPAT